MGDPVLKTHFKRGNSLKSGILPDCVTVKFCENESAIIKVKKKNKYLEIEYVYFELIPCFVISLLAINVNRNVLNS